MAKTAKKEEAPLREELAAVEENAEELVAELAATRLQLAASERSRKAAQKAAQEKDEECAGAKADALRLDDEVKRLESELAKVGVAEKIREREALRALQEREWERGEANADHARVLRDATTRAEDAAGVPVASQAIGGCRAGVPVASQAIGGCRGVASRAIGGCRGSSRRG